MKAQRKRDVWSPKLFQVREDTEECGKAEEENKRPVPVIR